VASGQECCCNKETEDEVEGSGLTLECTCGLRGIVGCAHAREWLPAETKFNGSTGRTQPGRETRIY
jgi:hypothetical protein